MTSTNGAPPTFPGLSQSVPVSLLGSSAAGTSAPLNPGYKEDEVGAHKTSMLQDYEAGRPMELEAVVGAVVELGERLGVTMTATRTLDACAKVLDEHRHRRLMPRPQEVVR